MPINKAETVTCPLTSKGVEIVDPDVKTTLERSVSGHCDHFYECTGDFREDFTKLCQLNGMAVIPPVVQCHGAHPDTKSQDRKSDRTGNLRLNRKTLEAKNQPKSASNRKPMDHHPEQTNRSGHGDATSKTVKPFTTRVNDKFLFFKPCVQVEMAELDDHSTVTEIFVRGWRVDEPMMDVFGQCCPVLNFLRVLYLWNVGLTPETVDMLASFLPLCEQLTTLNLDANPLGDSNVSHLIGDDSQLENLSLRFCELNDINAYGIGSALGTTKRWNRKLMNLNMSSNKIGDTGAIHIANGLKTNRALLTLNMANNQIGDKGGAALAGALSQFFLDQEQMLERRLMELEKESVRVAATEALSAETTTTSTDSFQARSRRHSNLPEKKRKLKEKEDKQTGAKGLRFSLNSFENAIKEKTGTKKCGKDTERRLKRLRQRVSQTEPVANHPLMEVGNLYEGQFWIMGNRSLISLNLSRNQIGEAGLRQLLEMIQVQAVPCHGQRQQPSMGLRRLVVERNAVARDNEVIQLINMQMDKRHPLYRMPLVTLHRTNVVPCAIPPITL